MKARIVRMKMPDLSTNDGAAIDIRGWLANVGDVIERGQTILEIETDKAVQEVEAIASGILSEQHVFAGDSVPVGTIIATIEVE